MLNISCYGGKTACVGNVTEISNLFTATSGKATCFTSSGRKISSGIKWLVGLMLVMMMVTCTSAISTKDKESIDNMISGNYSINGKTIEVKFEKSAVKYKPRKLDASGTNTGNVTNYISVPFSYAAETEKLVLENAMQKRQTQCLWSTRQQSFVTSSYSTDYGWQQMGNQCYQCGNGKSCGITEGQDTTWTQTFNIGLSSSGVSSWVTGVINLGYSYSYSHTISKSFNCQWTQGACHTYWMIAGATRSYANIATYDTWCGQIQSTTWASGESTMPNNWDSRSCQSGCCGGARCSDGQPWFCAAYATNENKDYYGTCNDWNAKYC